MKFPMEIMKCNKCRERIYDQDDYVKFAEFHEGTEIGNRFYHKRCFVDKMGAIKKNQLKDIIRRTKEMIMEE